MRLKKVLALSLSLMLLSVSAFAISVGDFLPGLGVEMEPAEVEVVEDTLLISADAMGVIARYTAAVRNKSDKPALIGTGELQLLDKDGNVVETRTLFGATPSLVQPGEVGYMNEKYIMLTEEQRTQIQSWKLVVDAKAVSPNELDDMYKVTVLPATFTVTERESADWDGNPTKSALLEVAVENNMAEPAFGTQVLALFRNADGKLIDAARTGSMGQGIPSGQSGLFRMDIYAEDYAALLEKGVQMDKIELIVVNE